MLRIDRAQRRLHRLEPKALPEVGMTERDDLQRMIRQCPAEFFDEIGEQVLLVAEEEKPAEFVDDRIDLLGIDPSGAAVVIELKRTSHKLHLLQAIAYAGMLAKWEASDFIEARQRFANHTYAEAEEEVESFLADELTSLNQTQRIVLLADAFDFEVLVAAEWLTERYKVDIRCYRFALARDGEADFLTCTRVYPPPELTQHAIRRGRKAAEPGDGRKTTWDEVYEWVRNPAVVQFFRDRLDEGWEDLVKTRRIKSGVGRNGVFFVRALKNFARFWQVGRFPGDLEFWRARLSNPEGLAENRSKRRVFFRLRTEEEFGAYLRAIEELRSTEFIRPADIGADEDDDGDEGDE